MKKIALAVLMTTFSFVSMAAELAPLSDSEVMGGAGCLILNARGKAIISDKVKLDGKLISVNSTITSKKTMNWTGNDIVIEFTLSKGKLLEDKDGFRVGKSPIGDLKITQKDVVFSMKAREECYGAD